MPKLSITGLVALPLALAALTPAAAQEPAAAAGTRPGFLAEQPATTLRLSKLRGVNLIGQDHTKLGDIDDVLIGPDGRLAALVVDVGGVLGMGGKTVAIPYQGVQWNTGDVSRVTTPSASLSPENAAPAEEARTAAAERMPGAGVSERALNAVPEGRSGAVDPATGPVTTGATERAPATVLVTGSDAPERAEVRLTKADIESAPAFRYAGER